MKLRIIATAILATALTGGLAQAAPSMKAQGLGWERAPQPIHMARYFPASAKSAGIKDASVELECTAKRFGALDCVATQETPAGHGFGEAAAQVVEKARVAARDRQSPEGKVFRYSVHFGEGLTRGLKGSAVAKAQTVGATD